MQEVIGFTWQEIGSGACGKFALRHALLTLGISVTARAADKATGLPKVATMAFGTSEKKLKKALRYFGCQAIEYSRNNPDALKQDLVEDHVYSLA